MPSITISPAARLGLLLLASLLTSTAAPAAMSGAARHRAETDRPNILWITSEDNSPYLGCYGDALAETPNLDRLAAAGLRYRHAFANAQSSSARTTLITGMYASTLGVQNHRSSVAIPEEFKLYPEHLRAAGCCCTNNARTNFNLAGRRDVWNQNGTQAHYRNRGAEQPFFAVFNITTSHESQVAPKKGKTSFRVPPKKSRSRRTIRHRRHPPRLGQLLRSNDADGRPGRAPAGRTRSRTTGRRHDRLLLRRPRRRVARAANAISTTRARECR